MPLITPIFRLITVPPDELPDVNPHGRQSSTCLRLPEACITQTTFVSTIKHLPAFVLSVPTAARGPRQGGTYFLCHVLHVRSCCPSSFTVAAKFFLQQFFVLLELFFFFCVLNVASVVAQEETESTVAPSAVCSFGATQKAMSFATHHTTVSEKNLPAMMMMTPAAILTTSRHMYRKVVLHSGLLRTMLQATSSPLQPRASVKRHGVRPASKFTMDSTRNSNPLVIASPFSRTKSSLILFLCLTVG